MDQSQSLGQRYAQARDLIRDGGVDDLNQAIELLREIIASVVEAPAIVRSDLGAAELRRFDLTADPDSLRSAVEATRSAIEAAQRESQPARLVDLSNLGIGLIRRYERSDDVEALDEAIDVLRRAAANASTDEPRFGTIQANLGLGLTRWMERTRDLSPLAEATGAHLAAIAASRDRPARAAQQLSNLGNTMMFALRETGERGYLDQAIAAHRQAVAVVPDDDPALPGCYAGLSAALVALSLNSADREPLLTAIALLGKGLSHTPTEHPDRALYLNQRAIALRINFARAGDVASLEEAIDSWREATGLVPADHPDRLAYRTNLALALRNRFEYLADRASLDEAVRLQRTVVADVAHDSPHRTGYQADLANSLHRLGGHTRDEAPLREAVQLLLAAAASRPHPHPDHVLYLSNVGATRLTLAEVRRDPAELAATVAVMNEVAQLVGEDGPELADVLFNLGAAQETGYTWDRNRAAFGAAVEAYQALADRPDAPARLRALAAQKLGRLRAADGDLVGALAGFTQAVRLLDLVAWLGLERDDQERLLSQFAGLASAAAACAVAVGDPGTAVELLEQGRGVLLTQATNTGAPSDIVRVRAPELAERLVALHGSLASTSSERTREGALDRQSLAAEREGVLDQIRKTPGLTAFLDPPGIDSLRATLGNRIVVAINVSAYRCDALVLTSTATHVVPLPDLRAADALARSAGLVAALEDGDEIEQTPILDTLGWLWDTVVGPVLDRLDDLGLTVRTHPVGRDTGEPGARVCWMPTGPLSFLPLHAAGHHRPADGDARSALNRVVSSYTATVRGLGAPGPVANRAPLVVAVPASPQHRPLPGAVREADVVARSLGERVTVMVGAQATREAVLSRLTGADWVHFACHATSTAAHPSDSYLAMYDGPLRVRDLAGRLGVEGGRRAVAYLSACTTAHGGQWVPDEHIHVASAFQLAGFGTVVGTLWPVTDSIAVRAARHTYAALGQTSSAGAVNSTARWLRERYRDQPSHWAGHVHIGVD
jgi:tetratricopeptide (TPR) repeat protein